jgi:hypothetical protein
VGDTEETWVTNEEHNSDQRQAADPLQALTCPCCGRLTTRAQSRRVASGNVARCQCASCRVQWTAVLSDQVLLAEEITA